MISIVIVSHSSTLAEGVRELAQQMVQDKVKLATAGGIDDPDDPIGTDPMRVHAAIEEVYDEDGVVVLMDLGSALMSAEMALEFLEPEQQKNVYLCEAPLVEGAVAAAVQAMSGGSVQQVMAEARSALMAKKEQLRPLLDETAPDNVGEEDGKAAADQPELTDALTLTLIIPNKMGLHARPASRFVEIANRFPAEIQVRKGENSFVNGKSLNRLATLGARQGDEIMIKAAGGGAQDALDAFQALADDNFGDVDKDDAEQEKEKETEKGKEAQEAQADGKSAAVPDGQLQGISAAPGIAIGPVIRYAPQIAEVPQESADDPAAEWAKLQEALTAAQEQIEQLQQEARQQVGEAEASIFGAHLLILQDPELLERVQNHIEENNMGAAAAWQAAIAEAAEEYRQLEDEYLRGRAADVEDVGQRVLRQLLGVEPFEFAFDEPQILAAPELTPSDTAQLSADNVLGILTERGGATSHSAILARALGIPAIVGLGAGLEQVEDGQEIGLDGKSGRVWLTPDDETLADLHERREAWLAEQEAIKEASQQEATTADGVRIEVAANIGGPNDAKPALEYGAEGVGLFRTEFLFMGRDEAPTEEEQYEAYAKVGEAFGERPVIIRTLDVGGDKPISYINFGEEENPFLGWRGIRYCLDTPEIFKPQLRAICRASAEHPLKLMFPMIGTVEELQRAKTMLQEVQAELTAAEIPFDAEMPVGMMIEVPAAVLNAQALAAEVDFFSIGTNDLTQYTMAADRGNANVSELAQALQPAVIRAIQRTAEAAEAAGIWVGMCGEMAGNAQATPLLVGLGLTELSMSGPSVPAVKAALREITLEQAQAIAAEAVTLATINEIETLLQQFEP